MRIVRASRQRGVTLLEMLIVVSLIALLAGLSYPSVASGLDSIRLRSTSDSIVAFFNAALERANRRQEAVELWISPKDNAMISRTASPDFVRRFDLPEEIRMRAVLPAVQSIEPDAPRRFLLYPGGTPPRIAVEIGTQQGHRRVVSVDPVTGSPHSEVVQ